MRRLVGRIGFEEWERKYKGRLWELFCIIRDDLGEGFLDSPDAFEGFEWVIYENSAKKRSILRGSRVSGYNEADSN